MKTLLLFLSILLLAIPQISTAQSAQAKLESSLSSADMLRQDMRKLWSDHVFWTRDYAAAAIANQPDEKAASVRLLKNQEDIGNAIAKYYGKAAGDKLTSLLKEHIMIAVDLIKAAKTHDQSKFQEVDRKWDRNGEEIAEFLSNANPNWPKATLSDMMKMHLTTTKAEVTARLNKDWEGDVKAFDDVYNHILKMSDALSTGIIKQFPDKFSATTN